MTKLNLIIADIDEVYVKGLSRYVNSYHPTAFSVSCFTRADSFIGYMERQPSADVLLIGPEFFDISACYTNIKLRAVLSGDLLSREYPGFQVIERFCTGEKLLGEVIHLYSKLNLPDMRLSAHLKDTRLVGVYSPAGGTGKTTIAAALAIQCNELGKRSFYLNLESIQSTGVFFNTNSKRNLSYVFYYLKEKSNNLAFRMEGIKSSDTHTGVEYFSPPESPLEYEEIDTAELEQLVRGLKGMGFYDYIIIDMSCAFDMKNSKIMSLCDHVLLLALHEPGSAIKNRVLLNELVKLSEAGMDSVSGKLITVINKYEDNSAESLESIADDTPVSVRVPRYSRTLIKEDGIMVIDDDGFRKAINQLINAVSDK